MKVATFIRILKRMDQQADVVLEVKGGRRYMARDIKQPGVVAGSTTSRAKVVISSE